MANQVPSKVPAGAVRLGPKAAAEVVRDDAYRTPLAIELAAAAAARPVEPFDISGFFGIGGKAVPAVGIRVPTLGEQSKAESSAHQYVAELAKTAGPGADALLADREIYSNIKAAAIVVQFCREMTPDPNTPGKWIHADWPAFPSTTWVADNLKPEQIGVLINLGNEVRVKQSKAPPLEDDVVEAYIGICTTIDEPEYQMIACSREMMVQLEIFTAHKVVEARKIIDAQAAEIAELRLRLGEREDLVVKTDGYICAGVRYPGEGPPRWVIGCKDLDGSMHFGPRCGPYLVLLTAPPDEAALQAWVAVVAGGTMSAEPLSSLVLASQDPEASAPAA